MVLARRCSGFARAFSARVRRPEHSETGQRNALDLIRGARLPLRFQTHCRSCLKQGGCGMRRRKLLRYEFRGKGDALEPADCAESPDEMHASQRQIERHRRPRTALWPELVCTQVSKKHFPLQTAIDSILRNSFKTKREALDSAKSFLECVYFLEQENKRISSVLRNASSKFAESEFCDCDVSTTFVPAVVQASLHF